MRTLTFLFAFVIIFTGLKAQDLEEVLQNYFETVGHDKYVEHNTLIIKGKSIGQGMENDFTIWQKRPNSFRLEVDIQGAKMIQVFDGEIGWYIAPWTGSTDPIEITGFQLASMEKQADFDGKLYKHREKGYQTELVGTEDMEGTEVFNIKQTDEEGNEYYSYIDAENYVVLKEVAKIKVDGSEVEVETLYSNYKEQGGMVMAYSMETRQNGQTVRQANMESFIFDEAIDDSLFAKPPKAESEEDLETKEEKEIEE